MRIRISWSSGEVTATLADTPTVTALAGALPFEGRANTWGEEIYFPVPMHAELEDDARQVVAPGTVCFWVEGSALALPYGRTPLSQGDEPCLVSRCNVLGKLDHEARALAGVVDGETVHVERVD